MELSGLRKQISDQRERTRATALRLGREAAAKAAIRHRELSNSSLAKRAPRPKFIAAALTEQERRDAREGKREMIDAPGWGGGKERDAVEADAGMIAVLSQVHAPVKSHRIFDPTAASRNSSSLERSVLFDPTARTIPVAPSFAAAVARAAEATPKQWRAADASTYDASEGEYIIFQKFNNFMLCCD